MNMFIPHEDIMILLYLIYYFSCYGRTKITEYITDELKFV